MHDIWSAASRRQCWATRKLRLIALWPLFLHSQYSAECKSYGFYCCHLKSCGEKLEEAQKELGLFMVEVFDFEKSLGCEVWELSPSSTQKTHTPPIHMNQGALRWWEETVQGAHETDQQATLTFLVSWRRAPNSTTGSRTCAWNPIAVLSQILTAIQQSNDI